MEKRNFSRVPFTIEAELECEDRVIHGQVDNLSLKGMMVKTNVHLELESQVKVRINLADLGDSIQIEIQGKVVRLVPNGIGVYFESMDLESLTHLSKIVEYNSEEPEKVKDELIAYISKNIAADKED